jgi:hypothetical protein
MDRGYVDFARLYSIHQSHAFFVTRAKRNKEVALSISSVPSRLTPRHLELIVHSAFVYGWWRLRTSSCRPSLKPRPPPLDF